MTAAFDAADRQHRRSTLPTGERPPASPHRMKLPWQGEKAPASAHGPDDALQRAIVDTWRGPPTGPRARWAHGRERASDTAPRHARLAGRGTVPFDAVASHEAGGGRESERAAPRLAGAGEDRDGTDPVPLTKPVAGHRLATDRTEIAVLVQDKENAVMGMNCGIMDPLASSIGAAPRIDGRRPAAPVPFPDGSVVVIVRWGAAILSDAGGRIARDRMARDRMVRDRATTGRPVRESHASSRVDTRITEPASERAVAVTKRVA